MERKYIESSMITSIGYDFSSAVLEIEFKSNGQVWQYFDFPESEWYQFESTESQGKYFNAEILNKYAESQVG
jgi:hypothetical protein